MPTSDSHRKASAGSSHPIALPCRRLAASLRACDPSLLESLPSSAAIGANPGYSTAYRFYNPATWSHRIFPRLPAFLHTFCNHGLGYRLDTLAFRYLLLTVPFFLIQTIYSSYPPQLSGMMTHFLSVNCSNAPVIKSIFQSYMLYAII